MKKVLVATLALIVSSVWALSASALENQFGGYWRTRAYTMGDFSGDDSKSGDFTLVDTRTRLLYTAKLNENLKFVNQFEMNAIWGDTKGKKDKEELKKKNGVSLDDMDFTYGDIGADGTTLKIKHTYADYNYMNTNIKVGAQPTTISRGLFFDDDFSGVHATVDAGMVKIPFWWAKIEEGGMGNHANHADYDYYGILPVIALAQDVTLNPLLIYASKDSDHIDIYYLGANVDIKAGSSTGWFTGIFQTGQNGETGSGDDMKVSAFLTALGGKADLQSLDIHGQVIYASGDDDQTDDKMKNFHVPAGQSYYWAEIMGYGIFDYQVSSGSVADQVSNLMAVNGGVTLKPMDKLGVSIDLWYAQLAEDNMAGETKLGTELDLTVSYEVIPGLNMDIVAAYLFSGKATGTEDPYELGTQLSLSF